MAMIGGLPPPRPDQRYNPPGPPGPVGGTAGVLAKLRVANSIINASGMFFYNGRPRAGNLITSLGVETAGFDTFGNAVLAGDTEYDPLALLALQLGGGGITAVTWYSAPSQAGPYSPVAKFQLRALDELDLFLPGTGNGLSRFVLSNTSPLSGGLTGALAEFQGTAAAASLDVAPAATAPPARPAGTEPWNYVGAAGQPAFGAGWSNFGGGFAHLAFRFVAAPSRCVQVKGEVTHTAAASQTIFTLPAAYVPASSQQFICMTSASGVVGVEVSAAGAVELLVAPAAIVTHNVDLMVSLDI